MGFRTLKACVDALRREKQLVVIDHPVDPDLEIAEVQRRLFRGGGPAVLFSHPRGSGFPVLVNLYGTQRRVERIFADSLDRVKRLVELKIDPTAALKKPWRYWRSPYDALSMLPKRRRSGPVLAHEIPLLSVPQVTSWPGDGGPFITLPAVYTEDPDRPGTQHSNIGMYRVQLGGNSYEPNREIGLHYQLHRGIGVHHAAALRRGEPLKVSIFVGGSPALAVAAVMPLPEGLSELTFAGVLAGHRIGMIARKNRPAIYAESDFVIEGTILPGATKPEGPFGDHLGYYSRQHQFPVMQVEHVWHREGAIWPITVVGRPPQEDTLFGWLVHELTGPIIPTVLPGVKSVHAVDASGVHPLLLVVGSERYLPWQASSRPAELLTQAAAILGQGQLSLAKYLLIISQGDAPGLDAGEIPAFLKHLLERVDWRRDCHFQTETSIDTLDYSGSGLNTGSKLVVAARGPAVRSLKCELPTGWSLPAGFSAPRVCLPGIVAVTGPPIEPASTLASPNGSDAAIWQLAASAPWAADVERFCQAIEPDHPLFDWPLIVVVDNSTWTAASLQNFLWVTFTRSNPAADVHGVGSVVHQKHWGCRGPLVVDARLKPHHAPPMEEDKTVSARIDTMCMTGGPLAGICS
ncbi:MAG: UbiD family decarboxylase [Planctomycetia bacterium]|nr:UbiD family decarboxylase [Planctomycetia bacterium]RLT16297.1 MAG: UbiD family decarboxylase [Planctomycetota bacterium]